MSVMEDMQSDAASKIQAGFRKIRSLSDTSSSVDPPKTPMSPTSIKKILPDERVAKALIDRVSSMTEADISALPLQAQANVRKLRTELGMDTDKKKIPIEFEAPSFQAVTPVAKSSDQGSDYDESSEEQESSEEETDSDDGEGYSQV